jgi:hypothetical protein
MYRNHCITTPGRSSHFQGLSKVVPDVFARRQIESFISSPQGRKCQIPNLLSISNYKVPKEKPALIFHAACAARFTALFEMMDEWRAIPSKTANSYVIENSIL